MADVEIGIGKSGRRAYGFDDIAIVPSRRTRDPQNVSLRWQIDAFEFSIPVIAAPMDSVMSPSTAIQLGQHGGLGVLDLEGGVLAHGGDGSAHHRIVVADHHPGHRIPPPSPDRWRHDTARSRGWRGLR